MTLRSRIAAPLVALLAATVAGSAAAAPSPAAARQVVARSGALTLTRQQLAALVAALPTATRARLARDPAALSDLVREAVLQDVLYATAHAAGWDRRADVAAEAEHARRTAIVRSYVAAQVPPPPPPTEAQVAAAYQQNRGRLLQPRGFHLAQIFLAVPPGAAPAQIEATRATLASLRPGLLAAPDRFAATARAKSADLHSARAGGDLGWIAQTDLAEPVRGIVLGLPEGGISDPVRTPDGWHLIRLIATRPAGPLSLDDARPAVLQALAEQSRQAAVRAYLDAQLQQHPIALDTAMLQPPAAAAPK